MANNLSSTFLHCWWLSPWLFLDISGEIFSFLTCCTPHRLSQTLVNTKYYKRLHPSKPTLVAFFCHKSKEGTASEDGKKMERLKFFWRLMRKKKVK